MYKLLTPDERVKVEGEYRARRAHAALMLGTTLIIFIGATLAPSLILVLGKKNAALLDLSSAEAKGESIEAKSLLSWAQTIRMEVATLAPPTQAPRPYEYFQKILKAKPVGVKITSLSYAKTGNILNAKGKAPDREALLAFQSNLVSSGDFSKVDFPVDNLAKESNIDFQLNLTPLP